MKSLKIVKRICCDVCVIILTVILVTPFTSFHGDLAKAEDLDQTENLVQSENLEYPYTKTFTISAYYSPLPCQNKYVTGSYDGDIYLNGSGVHGADGTQVYPGMIAAPKTISFGTKMYIPNVGIVSVHDRGGAIVASNGEEGVYDRLDIWMGYGDLGLKRALDWGKRTLDVTIYGLNDSISEEIYLEGYTEGEAVPNECIIETPEVVIAENDEPEIYNEKDEIIPVNEEVSSFELLTINLQLGDEGEEVLLLQNELYKLNYYKGELNGIYDDLTEHAVFKFQQSQYLIADENSPGAGLIGPKTRDRLNEIISARNYTKVLIAQNTNEKMAMEDALVAEENSEKIPEAVAKENEKPLLLSSELYFGMTSNDIKLLQEFLKKQGYFKGLLTTDYFGLVTKEAVIEFQIANNIISTSEDVGAGRVGPATLDAINTHS